MMNTIHPRAAWREAAGLSCFLLMAAPSTGWGEIPSLVVSLDQAVKGAFKISPALRAASLEAQAADDHARALYGPLLPRLNLEGAYRYVTEVPELSVVPGAPKVSFTTHNSYSIGPVLSLNVFEGGAFRYRWHAAQADARAKSLQADALRRQVRLAARLAYFQAILASERVRFLAESYRVEDAQYRDIKLRYHAGAASKIDLLSSHQQALTHQRQLLEARADLSSAIHELTSLCGIGESADATLPIDAETRLPLPEDLEAPSLIFRVDPASSSISRMQTQVASTLRLSLPQIDYLRELAVAARLSAQSVSGAHWPALSLLAKTTLDYPNGPLKESVNQNTLGASLSFPLFAGGTVVEETRMQRRLADSAEERRVQAIRDLSRDWDKSRDLAAGYSAQRSIARRSIEEAAELARLQYESYRAGRSRFLDVEDANLRVLQAKTDASRIDVELLIQLANLESLSVEEHP